jgi:hypothetical protein
MEKVIQRDTDHRYIVKKLGENRYQVTLQEYSRMQNVWYNVGTPDLYDKSGLSMLGITM